MLPARLLRGTHVLLVASLLALLPMDVARAEESKACKADLTADGVVNFRDLAALKAVFFQRCDDPGPICGDAVVQGPREQCDDGNLVSGDGCSRTCEIEIPPAVVCGNGIAQGPTEQCDDGNVLSGDGCSSICTIEPPTAGYRLLATAQTTCWNPMGQVIPCAGTGQDGDIQAGAPLAYTDNGDGTITDSNTGLMWEKLDDNNVGGIHDWSNFYNWADAFAVKIATLNAGGGFAGYTDWRLPNRRELDSIVNLEISYPGPTVHAAFNTACTAGCSVMSCSCTKPYYYWSSSTYAFSPGNAWTVHFYDGDVIVDYEPYLYFVRAVRGGL